MKKCVKCNRKFEDSNLVCKYCGLYLIADVVSDLSDHSTQEAKQSKSSGRRNRVVPIDEPNTTNVTVCESSFSPHNTGFEPSEETVDSDSIQNRGVSNRQHNRSNTGSGRNIRRFFRRYYPVFRIVIPILLLVVAIILIATNWLVVSDFLQCCLISGIIGGGLLTFLSVRFGHHFNIDVVTIGVIGGIIVGCVIKYNLFGTATGLSDLFVGMGPCIIIIIGIYVAVRGVFR